MRFPIQAMCLKFETIFPGVRFTRQWNSGHNTTWFNFKLGYLTFYIVLVGNVLESAKVRAARLARDEELKRENVLRNLWKRISDSFDVLYQREGYPKGLTLGRDNLKGTEYENDPEQFWEDGQMGGEFQCVTGSEITWVSKRSTLGIVNINDK